MYMNRFIVGFLLGVGISVSVVCCICTIDHKKCKWLKKNKKWAKCIPNIY